MIEITIDSYASYYRGLYASYEDELYAQISIEWNMAFQRKALEQFDGPVLQLAGAWQFGGAVGWQDLNCGKPIRLDVEPIGDYIVFAPGQTFSYLYQDQLPQIPDDELEGIVDGGEFCTYLKPRTTVADGIQTLLEANKLFATSKAERRDIAPEWIDLALNSFTFVLMEVMDGEFPLLYSREREENQAFLEHMLSILPPPDTYPLVDLRN